MKTNAMRVLDALSITYTVREYALEATMSAEIVAGKIGLPHEQVFKTLVARGDKNGVLFAVVPANGRLDLKALRHMSGNRSVEVVPLKELTPLTGYVRGGTTALAAKKDYPVYLDETALLFELMAVSAGVRGTQMVLSPQDYVRATKATVAALTLAVL